MLVFGWRGEDAWTVAMTILSTSYKDRTDQKAQQRVFLQSDTLQTDNVPTLVVESGETAGRHVGI